MHPRASPLGPGGRPFSPARVAVLLLVLGSLGVVGVLMLSDRAPGALRSVSDRLDAPARLPPNAVGDVTPASDTLVHLVVWGVVSALVGLVAWSWRSLAVGALGVLALATFVELAQDPLTRTRTTEASDLVTNAVGVGAGVLVVALWTLAWRAWSRVRLDASGGTVTIAAVTGAAAAGLLVAVALLGPGHLLVAVLVVWVPMVWLGTVSRVVPPRLPRRYLRLRPFELPPRCYERLGVRAAKVALRRGPFARFNPGLHLPVDRTPAHLARLEERMEIAEASHTILFVCALGAAVVFAASGWWSSALVATLANVVMNGYPAMLQRYNRALLQLRFAGATPREV